MRVRLSVKATARKRHVPMGYPSHAQKAATAPTAPGVCGPENMRKKSKNVFRFSKKTCSFFFDKQVSGSTPGPSGTQKPKKILKSKDHFLGDGFVLRIFWFSVFLEFFFGVTPVTVSGVAAFSVAESVAVERQAGFS
jgi:hypothetical protein